MHRILVVLLFFSTPLLAQISGRVIDAETRQPLAFVHVVINDSQLGTMTDIDGLFSLQIPPGKEHIQLSYVGYFTQSFLITNKDEPVLIYLYRRPYQLQEVVVYPGENPAHRIIRNAINNRNANNPERIPAFTYTSYNKFLATLDQDFYIERWQLTRDTFNKRMIDVLDKRHVFIMESVTERKFRAPNQSNETVIANRVSGMQNPMFTMLATELQPFSFYGNTITLIGKEYVSPLNRSAFNRYSYQLMDTLYQGTDSIFIISYQPVLNTNFDGLKGLLYINSQNWALQNVVAQPAKEIPGGLKFRIQQKYERINDQYWFPVQLNTDIDVFNSEASDPSAIRPIRMLGRSYIENIVLNPPLQSRDFSNFAVDFSPHAAKTDQAFWNQFRPDTLSSKEINTYYYMDSLGAAKNFEQLLNAVEPIMFGEIPLGVLSLPINSLYRFNDFERHRIGIGLKTNNHFSRRMALGGHYAWATGDKREKFGYFAELVIQKKNDIRLGGEYLFDVSERGGTNFMQQNFIISTLLIRNLYMDKMDYSRKLTAYLSFLAFRGFMQGELSAHAGKTFWTDLYYHSPGNNLPGVRSFQFAEASLRLRFAYGETLFNTPLRVMRLPSKYPVFYLNISKGFDNVYKGELDYIKAEARAEINYAIPLWGRQTWIVEGGWTSHQNLPWPLIYTAKAGNRDFYLASPFSFGTMGMNEFAADRFAAVFFQHNFESLLFRRPFYQPELVLITNIGFGSLHSKENHIFMEAKSWDKGYFESGIAINKILPRAWVRKIVFGMSPGIEVLYRYGPYSLPRQGDNLTIKLSMVLSL
jgi:hypothetical protein